MKLTSKQLRQIIKEELEAVLDEGSESFDHLVVLEPIGQGAMGGNAYQYKFEFQDKVDPNGGAEFTTSKKYSIEPIHIGSQDGLLNLAAIIAETEGYPEIAEKIKSGKTQAYADKMSYRRPK